MPCRVCRRDGSPPDRSHDFGGAASRIRARGAPLREPRPVAPGRQRARSSERPPGWRARGDRATTTPRAGRRPLRRARCDCPRAVPLAAARVSRLRSTTGTSVCRLEAFAAEERGPGDLRASAIGSSRPLTWIFLFPGTAAVFLGAFVRRVVEVRRDFRLSWGRRHGQRLSSESAGFQMRATPSGRTAGAIEGRSLDFAKVAK